MNQRLYDLLMARLKEAREARHEWAIMTFEDELAPVVPDPVDDDCPTAYEPRQGVKMALNAFARSCENHNAAVYPGYQGVFKPAQCWVWRVELQVDCRRMRV
jgi:hypothetical protein